MVKGYRSYGENVIRMRLHSLVASALQRLGCMNVVNVFPGMKSKSVWHGILGSVLKSFFMPKKYTKCV